MATNLNKHSREAIKHAIIHSTFAEREAELTKRAIDLAQRVYEAVMPEGFLLAIRSLPAEWFINAAFVDIRINGCTWRASASSRSWELPGPRPLPARMAHRYSTPDLDLQDGKHDAMIAEVKATCEAVESIETERSQLSAKLDSLLMSVRTVEKFQEVAPELADYIPAEVKQASQRGGLPVVMVGDLVTGLMKAGLKVPKN